MSDSSTWKIAESKKRPKQEGDIVADVAIVGAGITGILNAYMLAKAGKKVVVLEKEEDILQSATLYTTAFITQCIDTDFEKLIKMFGEEKAGLVWRSGGEAIALIHRIITEEKIECDFKFAPVITYAKDKSEFEFLEKEFGAIRHSGFEATLEADGTRLNFPNSGYLEIPNQAMFHPIKFASAVAQLAEAAGAQIFVSSEVLEAEEIKDGKRIVQTSSGTVEAEDVLIATYRPLTHQGTHFKKGMYVTYIYELEIKKGHIPEGMYLDLHNPYHYFRIDSGELSDRMIVGGEDHRKEIPIDEDKSYSMLLEYAEGILGPVNYKIVRKWRGPILEPSDGLALIGRIDEHLYVATAFSGNGMTYAAISSMLILDTIAGRANPYQEVYDPTRIPDIRQLIGKARDYGETFFGGAVRNFLKGSQDSR
ncbi:MAG: FAD-binding oxidoreductase [Candidatus Paceibacterota bacterium]